MVMVDSRLLQASPAASPQQLPRACQQAKNGACKNWSTLCIVQFIVMLIFLSQLKIPTPKHFCLSYSIFYCLAEKGMLETINKKQNFLQSLKIYNIANKKHKWMSPISDYIYLHLPWPVYQQKYTAWQIARVYTPNIRKTTRNILKFIAQGL